MCVFLFWSECERAPCDWRRWMLPPPSLPLNLRAQDFLVFSVFLFLCRGNRRWQLPQILRGLTESSRPHFAWQLLINAHEYLVYDKTLTVQDVDVAGKWDWATARLCVSLFIHCAHGQCWCYCTSHMLQWPVSGYWRTESMTLSSLLSLAYAFEHLAPSFLHCLVLKRPLLSLPSLYCTEREGCFCQKSMHICSCRTSLSRSEENCTDELLEKTSTQHMYLWNIRMYLPFV